MKWLQSEAWISLPYIIICIFMIVGAPEIRFFIAGYFLMYGYVSFRMNFEETLSVIRQNPWRVLICAGILWLMWVSIIGSTLSSSTFGVQLFGK